MVRADRREGGHTEELISPVTDGGGEQCIDGDIFPMEILSRTSLKTLAAMRCTSKYFEKLTYDSYFLNLYKQKNDIVSGFLVQRGREDWDITEFAPSPGSNSLDLGFLPRNCEILASSEQGIIVFQSSHPRFCEPVCYHVCKPATKQVLDLPNPKTKYPTEKVAMVVMGSKPLHYKIVRLSDPKFYQYDLYTPYRCEIFDSKAWTWRLKEPVILPSSVFVSNEKPITARGSISILLTNSEVLKFDAYSETWTTFSSPIQTLDNPLSHNVRLRKLVKYQGKLGFACITPSLCSWEIWVLRVDELWEKLHVLDLNYCVTNPSFIGETLEAIHDSDTRVAWEKTTLAFYRFKGGDYVSKVPLFKGGYHPCRIFPFQSDSERADLRS